MSEYCIKNGSILEINGKQLDFKYNINKIIDMNNILVVLLDAAIKHWHDEGTFNLPNGIYGVSYQAEVLWNIEMFFRPVNKYNNSCNMLSNKVIEMNPYNTYNYLHRKSLTTFTDIKRLTDSSLAVYTDVGTAYVLDIEKKETVGSFKSTVKCSGNMDYRIKDGSILVIAGKQLDFVFNIEKVIEIENMLVIGLSDMEGLHNGIYAISPEGEILWNIEEFFRPGNQNNLELYPDGMLWLSCIDSDRNLVVWESAGIQYTLDIKNKLILDRLFTK